MLNTFKDKLKKGESVFGPFMKTCDAAFVEIAGYAGFDFVILDMEHGPVSFETLQNLIRGAVISGTIPIVRASDSKEISISRALDIGAYGIQIPQVRTVEEAKACISAAKFYPAGERGVCRFVRAASYSAIPGNEYFSKANDTLVILQLEGSQAIENLDEIIKVKGIDILFIGPYDLSQSLGLPGQIDHPKVKNEVASIVEKAKKRDIIVGTFADTIDGARMWKQEGIQYISHSVDVGIFMDACSEIIKIMHH
jgi:4-hydroxy-2-oxoheptanedioate aldolase